MENDRLNKMLSALTVVDTFRRFSPVIYERSCHRGKDGIAMPDLTPQEGNLFPFATDRGTMRLTP